MLPTRVLVNIVEYKISDRLLLFIAKHIKLEIIVKKKIRVKSYKHHDVKLMKMLFSYSWGRFYATCVVDEAWNILHDQILIQTNFSPLMYTAL